MRYRLYLKLINTILFFSVANLLSCTNAVPDIESLSLKDTLILNPSSTYSSITGTSSIIADGSSSSVITITLKNSDQKPVVNEIPTFSATDTENTNIYGKCSATDNNGVALCTLTSTKAEVKSLTMIKPLNLQGDSIEFIAGASYSTKFRQKPANGRAFYQITEPIFIDIIDAYGNLTKENSLSTALSIPGGTTYSSTTTNGGTAEFSSSYYFQTAGAYTIASSFNSTSTTSSPFKIITTALSWGRNEQGELGFSNLISADQTTPVLIDTEKDGDLYALSFVGISAGGYYDGTNTNTHTCGITDAGKAYCWGSNSDGQLGSTDILVGEKSLTPTLVSGSILFTQISAGSLHTCGIASDDKAYCWGHNNQGQLGENSTINTRSLMPILVSNTISFSQISAGTNYTCGISKADSKAYCWGSNDLGQLGTNTILSTNTPELVNGSHTFTQISTGAYHTCGITTNSNAYCWGYNNQGQLGENSTINTHSLIPILASNTISFDQISAGANYTCGISKTDSKAYCWGTNDLGQLGTNTILPTNIPELVNGSHTFNQISAGNKSTCGITTSLNEAYCWGFNNHGQLGIGTFATYLSTPTPVLSPSDTSWSGGTQLKLNTISVGYNHAVGIIGIPGL